MPLPWRIFVGNALVLGVATTALVLTPVTVSFPAAERELVVLAAGARDCARRTNRRAPPRNSQSSSSSRTMTAMMSAMIAMVRVFIPYVPFVCERY